MPSKATSHRGAGAASRKGQVPRPRGQQARKAAGARHEGPTVPRMPSMPASPSMPVLPSMRALRLPRVRVPGGTAGNMLWWGGLAVVAAFGVVDWPVAALVAAGTWVAEQHAGLADRVRAAR